MILAEIANLIAKVELQLAEARRRNALYEATYCVGFLADLQKLYDSAVIWQSFVG